MTRGGWQELIERGFPFVKTAALSKSGLNDWQHLLAARGYDTAIAARTLGVIEQGQTRLIDKPLPPPPLRDAVDDFAIAVPNALRWTWKAPGPACGDLSPFPYRSRS